MKFQKFIFIIDSFSDYFVQAASGKIGFDKYSVGEYNPYDFNLERKRGTSSRVDADVTVFTAHMDEFLEQRRLIAFLEKDEGT